MLDENEKTKVKIYGVKITRQGSGCYRISVAHSGRFRLADYDTLELHANAVRMEPRR